MKSRAPNDAPAAQRQAAASRAAPQGDKAGITEGAEAVMSRAQVPSLQQLDASPRQVAQRHLLGAAFGSAGLLQQRKRPVPLKARPPLQLKIGLGKDGALVCSVANNAKVGTAVWRNEQNVYDIDAAGVLIARNITPQDEAYTVAELEHLKMNAGSMKDYDDTLAPELGELSDIAGSIYTRRGLTNRLLPCGSFDVTPMQTDFSGLMDVMGDSASRLAGFMSKFMALNGQMPYIFNSPGFQRGDWTVQVDINYYTDRKPEGGWGPHKDTEGSNLFVNLFFNNARRIPGTEFTNDTEGFGARQGPAKFLPDDLQEKISKAKTAIKSDKGDEANDLWKGGVLEAGGYVSLVDELVWHSTPIPKKRDRYSIKLTGKYLLESYIALYKSGFIHAYQSDEREVLRLKDEELFNTNVNLLNQIYQLMMTFAEEPRPELANIALPGSQNAWAQLERTDQLKIINTVAALMLKTAGVMVSTGGTGDVVEDSVPTKVASRPRSKSSSDLSKWAELDTANENIPRSFFRTWVRIKKAGTTLPKSL